MTKECGKTVTAFGAFKHNSSMYKVFKTNYIDYTLEPNHFPVFCSALASVDPFHSELVVKLGLIFALFALGRLAAI